MKSPDVRWHPHSLDRLTRAQLKGQQGRVLWFTGLSGAGKSTIANLAERTLWGMGRHTMMLDGDNLRHGLNRDLGFTDIDRVENVRRVAEVARLMVDAGLIVLVALISPFRADRALARQRFEPGEFIEIHVDVPLALAEARDPKGLYRKARGGLIRQMTGIDSPYEAPERPELLLDTSVLGAEAAAQRVVDLVRAQGASRGVISQ